jgi:signal transduction histidine kinase
MAWAFNFHPTSEGFRADFFRNGSQNAEGKNQQMMSVAMIPHGSLVKIKMSLRWTILGSVIGFAVVFSDESLSALKAEELTSASEVLALPGEHALQGVPVTLQGIVTAAEKYWEGRFFLQDASGGVFVDNVSPTQPEAGDLVKVKGISHPGAFAPVVSKPVWKKIGADSLPRAKPVLIEELMSGVEDGQRVEMRGIVRTARIEHSLLSVDLESGGCRFHVFARPIPDLEIPRLIGSRVRVRGTAAASFNAHLRRLISVKIFAPLPEDFVVEKTEELEPYSGPVLPLAAIAQYRRDNSPGARVHVKGTLTCQRLGQDLFLFDGSTGLRIKTHEPVRFSVGDIIEATGFPALDQFLPVLEDAICRKTSEPRLPAVPRPASIEEVRAGLHHANLITIRGTLLDRTVRRALDRAHEAMQVETSMTLQAEGLIFSAEAETWEDPARLASVPLGSVVEATGVCLSEIGEDGKLKLLRLLLPPGQELRTLTTPPWLTPRRLSISLAAAFGILFLALSFNLLMSKKNRTLKTLVLEKEQAQEELQLAHRGLEERVRERTEQLKQQITARKESELQFKGVLKERTRLAQELHDTLEQTLTGIALQMDTATRLVERSPGEANHHLLLARTMVGQGQTEVRRSVWDLRSRALEEFDLSAVLAATVRQLTDGTGIEVTVNAKGQVRRLPDLIEDNLLRIAQEALTNAIKHSGGTCAAIEMNYGNETVTLEIKDDGIGFIVETCAGPLDGHFGLLGISERVKRLNGRMAIHGLPGHGTRIHVEIPIQTEPNIVSPVLIAMGV